MNFIDTLIEADKWLFQQINCGLGNPVFDAILPWFRDKWFWAPVYLFVAAISVLNYGKKGWVIILGLLCCVALSDTVSSVLVKKQVQRIRPCNDVAMADRICPRVSCGGGYSFTSSHAANHFAAAVFLIGVFGFLSPRIKWIALSWAAVIAFAQVYVGVHYPADVLCGSLLGIALGLLVLKGFKTLKNNPLASIQAA